VAQLFFGAKMKKMIISSLCLCALLTMAQAQDVKPQLNKSSYTLDDIYNTMCIECHRADGSGNTEKLTPSLKDSTLEEMASALLDIEDEKGHIVMEHNRDKILERGMEYGAYEMAEYMYKRFHPEKSK
jgi:cytochrome c553